jgi:hypothetical protein
MLEQIHARAGECTRASKANLEVVVLVMRLLVLLKLLGRLPT